MEAVRLTNDVDARNEWQNSARVDFAFVRILDGRAKEHGLSSSF
jgi:hypothetical protein